MSNKTVIGNERGSLDCEAREQQARADESAGDLTMMQRRIRMFESELTFVQFPDGAPSWADNWLEWLLTGEVQAPAVGEVEEAGDDQRELTTVVVPAVAEVGDDEADTGEALATVDELPRTEGADDSAPTV